MQKIQDIRQIQSLLDGGLRHLKAVCQKHGLRFFLSNGTLLGAVKYQNFIPWDDDADILMPREDYDRLMALPDVDTAEYVLLCRQRQPDWKMPYAKLSMARTLVQETTADFGVKCGLSIDIFPIDTWADSQGLARLRAGWDSLLRRFYSASVEERFFTPRTGVTRGILFCIWCYSRLTGTALHRRCIESLIRQGGRSREGNFVGSIAWCPYGTREVFPRAVFESAVPVLLGGEEYPAPVGYDAYLRSLYGDYPQDPPKEKQKTHHTLQVWLLDTEESHGT